MTYKEQFFIILNFYHFIIILQSSKWLFEVGRSFIRYRNIITDFQIGHTKLEDCH